MSGIFDKPRILDSTRDKYFRLVGTTVDSGDYADLQLPSFGGTKTIGLASDRLKTYYSADFDNPNNSDWAVNSLAPASADSNNAGLTVRLFDDTTEEGVGFSEYVPSEATELQITFVVRAESGPAGAANVQFTSYVREIGHNAAPTAWTAGHDHTAISIPSGSENWQVVTDTVTLASLGISSDNLQVQFELTRNTGVASNLSGDATLYAVRVNWF